MKQMCKKKYPPPHLCRNKLSVEPRLQTTVRQLGLESSIWPDRGWWILTIFHEQKWLWSAWRFVILIPEEEKEPIILISAANWNPQMARAYQVIITFISFYQNVLQSQYMYISKLWIKGDMIHQVFIRLQVVESYLFKHFFLQL